MSRIQETFNQLKKRKEGALITFTTLGDPSLRRSVQLARRLAESGADILELGLPFSDPVADGPTIQASYQRALKAGMNTHRALEAVRKLRDKVKTPLVLLSYYNPVLRRGVAGFFRDFAEAGLDGVVVPDLPVEEAEPVSKAGKDAGVNLIFLVAPTTTERRLEKIVKAAEGFLYLVSLLGVTGARESLSALTKKTISRIAKHVEARIPVAVGFGISKPPHVREVIAAGADGAIVGSALIDLYTSSASNPAQALEKVSAYVHTLKAATAKKA
ncbi:tryptophan synthase subunit alpha [Candidatus Hecatella orcuttiae]|jgi:tryptophan synthase alpha chain|uniref:tryptophan synthase subunit alpha n=1 Tax=Candidatus Hecatella orcuttiae TaxID=1935119 RepID=UPI002867E3CF|nr:tryptophan synthase subunit alpha [Candidatus Hecatella orcuttiae]